MEMLPLKSMKDHCSPAEWKARIDLAACYRLVAHYGMSDMMANHISLRVPGEDNAFLINPYGMLYEEITASSLIKIDLDGNILAKPDFGANWQIRAQVQFMFPRRERLQERARAEHRAQLSRGRGRGASGRPRPAPGASGSAAP